MRKFLLFCLVAMSCGIIQAQSDTVVVQTLTFDSTTRNAMFQFPEGDHNQYEKIIMQYRMRCKNALISDGADRNKGCGEWDYSCNTYIVDSARIDSMPSTANDHAITGFSGTSFPYTTNPTFTFTEYVQKDVVVSNIENEQTGTIGVTTLGTTKAIATQYESGKSQYLIHAEDLYDVFTAGEIQGIKLQGLEDQVQAGFLRVKMAATSSDELTEMMESSAMTEVFYRDLTVEAGENNLYFHTPFQLDGLSNLVVEFSFTNNRIEGDLALSGGVIAPNSALSSDRTDKFLGLLGVNQHVDIDDIEKDFSTGLTVAAWVKFDGLGSWSRIMDFGNGPGFDNILMAHPGTTNGLRFSVRQGGNAQFVDATDVFTIGEWTHVAGTVDANGNGTLYVNGEIVDQNAVHLPLPMKRTINYIGRSNWNNDAHYEGGIDDMSMWTTALTQSEVQDLMLGDLTANHSKIDDLVFGYTFNDGMATDISPNAINGTWVNAPDANTFRGDRIFKNMVAIEEAPIFNLIAADITATVNDVVVRDSIENAPNVVTRFEVVPNPGTLIHDELAEADVQELYEAVPQKIYDEWGVEIGEVVVPAEDSIQIGTLAYMRRWPSAIEIMSFVTPYGINLDLGVDGVMWEFDMTDFGPILKGNKRMYLSRGGQNQEEMDIKFLFVKGTPERDVLNLEQLWRVNSTNYQTINAEGQYEPRNVMVPGDAVHGKIRTMVTGHGQEGEFIRRQHYIDVGNNEQRWEWDAWTECAENAIYPQGGTWVYDRAGWCPGAPTDLQQFNITPFMTPGEALTVDYGVAVASGDSRYIVNNQVVWYGAYNHANDGAIDHIIKPSKRTEYGRFNTACSHPSFMFKNTGRNEITSATFNYWVNEEEVKSYTWEGSLASSEMIEVELPLETSAFWRNASENKFNVEITAINGAKDDYANNNGYAADYNAVPIINDTLVINYKTDFRASELSYVITTKDGEEVYNANGFRNNRNVYDTLSFAPGCYEIKWNDRGDDGMGWWPYQGSRGTGYFRIRSVNATFSQNFGSDYGDNIRMEFIIDGEDDGTYTVNKENIELSNNDLGEMKYVNMYPNPSIDGIFNVHAGLGFDKNDIIRVTDMTGRVVYTNTIMEGNNRQVIDISGASAGVYLVNIERKGLNVWSKKLIKQ